MKAPLPAQAAILLAGCFCAPLFAQDGTTKIRADLFCGPRCVRYTLMSYGKEEGLVDIIREMQGEDLGKGSTFAEISDALAKRGVHCRAVELAGPFEVRWSYPVIVHFPGDGKKILGHFGVWLPKESGREGEFVWVGLPGVRRFEAEAFSMIATKTVLLTAPAEITDRDLAGLRAGGYFWWFLGATVTILALGACLLVKARVKSAATKA